MKEKEKQKCRQTKSLFKAKTYENADEFILRGSIVRDEEDNLRIIDEEGQRFLLSDFLKNILGLSVKVTIVVMREEIVEDNDCTNEGQS